MKKYIIKYPDGKVELINPLLLVALLTLGIIEEVKEEPQEEWPKNGDEYYVPDFTALKLYSRCTWVNNVIDRHFRERGLIHRTPEEAIACAEKMLAVVKE